MKKMKNAMFAIAAGLLTLTVATESCGKKDNPTPVISSPAITSISPTTAAVGATITITGTNFTSPLTVTFNGVSTAVTATGVTSTSATAVVPTGATTGNLTVTCGGLTSNGVTLTISTTPPPPVLTSDSIGTANLIAHWTFDVDSKEKGSGVAASTITGADFSQAGKIGNCATFTNGYLVYPPINSINQDTALESYTISMWVNLPPDNANPLTSLFQITGNRFPDIWGQVAFELTNNGVVGDTLPLQARQVQVDGTAPYVHNVTTGANYGNSTNKWTFITQTYDGNGNNQTMKIFANGALIDSTQLTDVDKNPADFQTTFRIIPTGAANTSPTPDNIVYIGTLAFFDRGNTAGDGYGNLAPTWSLANYPWAAESITGKIDDIRVFNRPLTTAEVLALYTIGSTGK